MTTSILSPGPLGALVLTAFVLGGCADFSAQVFEQELPRAERPALYCYATLARSDCYETAVPGWEDRLIGIREEYVAPVEDEDLPPLPGQPAPAATTNTTVAPVPPPVMPSAPSATATGAAMTVTTPAGPTSSTVAPPAPTPGQPVPARPVPTRLDGQPLSLVR